MPNELIDNEIEGQRTEHVVGHHHGKQDSGPLNESGCSGRLAARE